jgi:DNA gyrase/topoisomerase IV subunit A
MFFYLIILLIAIASIQRIVPSMLDGLKLSQRKFFFASLETNQYDEVNAEDLTDIVSKCYGYCHAEDVLCDTIIMSISQL